MKELGKLADGIEIEQPQGGLFLRVGPTGKDGKIKNTVKFPKHDIEQGVAFVPGAPFFATDADAATLRLSFATADVGKILEGVGWLGKAIQC